MPGRRAALARRSGAPRPRRRPRSANSTAGSRLPCSARGRRSGGRPRPAAPASRPPRRPRPPRPSRRSSSPVPTPKWIRGTPASASPASTRARVRQRRTRGSRAADSAPAHESNSCTASTPGVDLRAQERRGDVGEPAPSGACHTLRRRRASAPWCARGCGSGRPRPGSDARVNGAPAKPISGVSPSSPHQQADGLGDRRDLARGAGPAAARRRRPCAPAAATTGPGAGHDVDVDAGGVQRHDDVAEQDRRVDPVPAHRLQRDLAGELRGSGRPRACRCRRAARGTRAATAPPGA